VHRIGAHRPQVTAGGAVVLKNAGRQKQCQFDCVCFEYGRTSSSRACVVKSPSKGLAVDMPSMHVEYRTVWGVRSTAAALNIEPR
jgi:hypothetical protein